MRRGRTLKRATTSLNDLPQRPPPITSPDYLNLSRGVYPESQMSICINLLKFHLMNEVKFSFVDLQMVFPYTAFILIRISKHLFLRGGWHEGTWNRWEPS